MFCCYHFVDTAVALSKIRCTKNMIFSSFSKTYQWPNGDSTILRTHQQPSRSLQLLFYTQFVFVLVFLRPAMSRNSASIGFVRMFYGSRKFQALDSRLMILQCPKRFE